MRAVAIRGFGVVSAYGAGVAPLVAGIRARQDVARPLGLFESAAGTPWVNEIDRTRFPLTAPGLLALTQTAVHEALTMAGVDRRALSGDTALVCGGLSGQPLAEENYRRHYRAWANEQRQPIPDPGALSAELAGALGLRGPVVTINTACSSAANALLVGRDLVLRGAVRRALVLGIESLSAGAVGGFHSLLMLASDGCRPFDANRCGLQLGEASSAILIEAGTGDVELLGGANRCDTFHVTRANPDGSGMAECMHAALQAAGVAASEIFAIKAHGTGSRENDAAEAAAMHRVFGDRLPPFTGLKRYLGHTLGACGAVETTALLGCLAHGFVPATFGFTTPDPELAVVPLTQHQDAAPGHYLLNYFGFGGNFSSLVVRHG
jgi:3-oxoacyl-(acyl-carrier-protein) synthase